MQEHLLRFNQNKKLTFLDFETENLCLYLPKNLPWQAAVVKVQGNNITASYDAYLKWHRPFQVSAGAALATRYDPLKVERLGIPSQEVVETIVKWTEDSDYIVGHNLLGFDIYFLREFYKLCGKSTKGLVEKIIDTHPLAKGIKLNDLFDEKKSSLTEYQYRLIHTIAKGVKTNTLTLGKENGIEHDYENLHDALVDLQLLVKIWNKIKYQVDI